MIFQNTINEIKEKIKKAKKIPIISMAELRIAEKLSKEVENEINKLLEKGLLNGKRYNFVIDGEELKLELNKL